MSRLYSSLLAPRVLSATRASSSVHSAQPLFLVLRRRTANMAASSLSPTNGTPRVPGPTVSVGWLKQHYDGVKVLDGSWYLPAQKQDAHANYLRGHLPGARFFDLEHATSKEGDHADLPHMLPSAPQLSAYLASLGVAPSDCVVVYDGLGIFSAPRIRLTLRHFGVDNVAVLEGGIKAWVAEGGSVESGEPAPVPPAVVAAAAATPLEPKAGFVRSMDEIAANVSKQEFTVVDARARGRFDGKEPEPRPDIPSGHIEGAKSVPFMSLLETDEKTGATMLRKPAELASVFKAAGVDLQSPRPIVASCGSGVTACVVLLGMEAAGRKDNVGLYDGSWTEWALRGGKITKTQ